MSGISARRPVVVVTGMGVLTSLGNGQAENWSALTAGQSGIRTISRFPIDALRTTFAGTVDFLNEATAPALSERLAALAIEEAIDEAAIGVPGNFPGPLFLAMPPVEIDWQQKLELAAASGAGEAVGYADLLRAAATGRFKPYFERFLFSSIGEHLADRFGTRGSPIALSTACASGATAIQLAVEAIRRGECEAALAAGTDASVTPEGLIRFSLLSALSTRNDDPAGAARPFAKDRDGFVMAEGAGALVLESMESARARGRDTGRDRWQRRACRGLSPHALVARRQADHRDDEARAGRRWARAGRDRLHQRARHRHAGERQDGVAGGVRRVRRARARTPDQQQQVDDRAHAVGGRRHRSRVHGPHAARGRAAADDQLPRARSGDPDRLRAQSRTAHKRAARGVQQLRLRRAERLAGDLGRAAVMRALVIGGRRGIGAAVVRALAARSWGVTYTYRTEPDGLAEMPTTGGAVEAARLDLS